MRAYIILALVGIVVAALAATLVRQATPPAAPAEEAQAPTSTVRVVVAKSDIPPGTFIRPDMHLEWSHWPVEQVQAPPYMTERTTTLDAFSGAVARRVIFAGEPVPQSSLVKSGEGGFMAAVLQPGSRAVSVAVTATSGNAGFIFPGDHVDLILTHSISTLSGETYASETFVENVRVLAVDQLLDNPENKAMLAKTVTLEVSPQQAEAVHVATEMGRIALSLRSLGNAADDEQPASTATSDAAYGEEIDIEYFYPNGDAGAAQKPTPFTRDRDVSRILGGSGGATSRRIRVIQGDTQKEIEFPQPGR